MLATDTHLQVTPDCLAAFHSDTNQLAHTLEIYINKLIRRQNTQLLVIRQVKSPHRRG